MANGFNITHGLDLPLSGAPLSHAILEGPKVGTVALLGDDFIGLKPTMEVSEGDTVKLGQVLFTDKKNPGVQFTSPGAGRVAAVNRGPKRKFESVVIELKDGESEADEVAFESYADHNLTQLDRRQVCEQLVASGLWTALRERPYGKVPTPNSITDALFVTAIDTNPLAVDPEIVLARKEREFTAGLQALSTLSDGPTYLCVAGGAHIPSKNESCVTVAEFSGPHPAGLPGTHIHFLSPVSDSRTAWYINYQDVIAVGELFLTGRLSVERGISLGGPAAKSPRLIRTRLGANLTELTAGEFESNENQAVRVVSGSALSGRTSVAPCDFLGRHHLQATLLKEGTNREFLGWVAPGKEKFSVMRVFASALAKADEPQEFALTTSTEGSYRAIVPIGAYEKVMPLDIIATPLLKALVTNDTEYAQALGCLELEEEDLALCTFVCPGKHEYGPILRSNLTKIEQEG